MKLAKPTITHSKLIALILILYGLSPFLIGLNFYIMRVLTFTLIYAILASGVSACIMFDKLAIFGYSLYFGIGAYTSAIFSHPLVSLKLGWSPLLTIMLGAVMATLIALAYNSVGLRLRGIFYGLSTSAVNSIAFLIINNWYEVSLGSNGIWGIPSLPVTGMIDLSHPISFYYILFCIFLMEILIWFRIDRSWIGYVCRAMREDEDAAKSIGINPYIFHQINLTIAAFFAGLTGGVYAHYMGVVDPFTAFNNSVWAITPILMGLLGGVNYLLGPLLGAPIISLSREFIFRRILPFSSDILLGLLLIFIVLYEPEGIIGWLEKKLKG